MKAEGTRHLTRTHNSTSLALAGATRGLRAEHYVEAVLDAAARPFGGLPVDTSSPSARAVFDASAAIGAIRGCTARGFYVPLDLGFRDLNVGTPTAGGNLATQMHDGSIVAALRPYSGVMTAGARVVTGLGEAMILPRETTATGVHWLDEGDAAGTADPEFGQVVVQPRTLVARVAFSRRLAQTSGVRAGIAAALTDGLVASLMTEVDRVVLAGSGTGAEPTGILNDGDVTVVGAGTNGAAPSYDLLTQIEEAHGAASGMAATGWFTNSAARRKLRKTERGAGLDYVWSDANTMLGIPAHATEHLPGDLTKGSGTGLSPLVLGTWSNVVIGIWGPAAYDLLVDPYTSGSAGLVKLTAFMEVGIAIRHPETFVVCKDLVTA